jgi:selenide,water dikinase
MGFCPGGLHRNREFYSKAVEIAAEIPRDMQDVLFDPQTSGGLLISLPPDAAERLVDRLHQAAVPEATIIGEVVSRPRGKVLVV